MSFFWNKSLTKVVKSHDFIALVIVVFAAWLASRSLFAGGYFNMHDDLQMMRQLSMEKCFLDLQIPCRWIPDMGYGFGYPLFNFYPPLPYLVGEIFRVIGYSFVDTAKALFILSFFVSGVTMYYLAKNFFGRAGGVLSAVFYIWAPYHAVDVFVRGAMNESWGLMWFPAILLFSYKLLSKPVPSFKKKDVFEFLPNVILLALSWAALLTSHNLMVIIFTPFFALWCVVWLVKSKNWKSVVPLVVSGLWAFGLAAFFTLPVFLEKNIVQTDTLIKGYYEYTAHFPSARQLLFSRFWGFGPSVWLENDGMSFQIGWFHWITPLVVGALLFIRTLKTKKFDQLFWVISIALVIGATATFMTHPRSTPIWAHIQALQFIQFPWRYLTMVILGFSFAVGGLVRLIPKAFSYPIAVVLMAGAIAYSWGYFLPEHGKLGPLTDQEKFTGAAWELQQTAGIYDYLPNTAWTAPHGPRKVQAEIMEGTGEVITGTSGTNWEKFSVKAETDVTVRVSLLQFPTWHVLVDGVETPTFVPKTEEWGRLYVNIPKGDHEVSVKLSDTPVRTAGNIISIVSWVLLGLILFFRRNTLMHKA